MLLWLGCLCGGRNGVREKAEVHEIEIEKERKKEREKDRAMTNGFFLPAGAACDVLCIPSLAD